MSFVQKYNALLARVEAAADDALGREVAETVRDIMEEQTEYQVYSYEASPMAMASRRADCGGLGDRRNMAAAVLPGHELTVENTAPFQSPASGGSALSDVVEQGLSRYHQPGPRPFVAGTQEEAVSSGRAYRALMRGLHRNGL